MDSIAQLCWKKKDIICILTLPVVINIYLRLKIYFIDKDRCGATVRMRIHIVNLIGQDRVSRDVSFIGKPPLPPKILSRYL